MRVIYKFLILLILSASFGGEVYAQEPATPFGTPTGASKFDGKLYINGALYIPVYSGTPVIPSVWAPRRPGSLMLKLGSDTSLMIYNGIDWVPAGGVNSIYRKPGTDSVFYSMGGRDRFAFKDSSFNQPMLTYRSVPFVGSNGKLTQDNTNFHYDGSLTVGNGDFYSESGLNLNGGRGKITASGFGLQIGTTGGGSNGADASKHIRFRNSTREYLHLYLPSDATPQTTPLEGEASMNWYPSITDSFDMGKSNKRWRNGYFKNIYINGNLFDPNLSGTYVPLSQKGQTNGVATLDGTGKVPTSQLPSFSVTPPTYMQTKVEMLASAVTVGGIVLLGDSSKFYTLLSTPASDFNNWLELKTAILESTDALPEGLSRLYYTTARARSAIGGSGRITYNSATGVIGVTPPDWDIPGDILNQPTIPPPLAPVGGSNISITGTFPNLTFDTKNIYTIPQSDSIATKLRGEMQIAAAGGVTLAQLDSASTVVKTRLADSTLLVRNLINDSTVKAGNGLDKTGNVMSLSSTTLSDINGKLNKGDSSLYTTVTRLKDTASAIRSAFTSIPNFFNSDLTPTGNRHHNFTPSYTRYDLRMEGIDTFGVDAEYTGIYGSIIKLGGTLDMPQFSFGYSSKYANIGWSGTNYPSGVVMVLYGDTTRSLITNGTPGWYSDVVDSYDARTVNSASAGSIFNDNKYLVVERRTSYDTLNLIFGNASYISGSVDSIKVTPFFRNSPPEYQPYLWDSITNIKYRLNLYAPQTYSFAQSLAPMTFTRRFKIVYDHNERVPGFGTRIVARVDTTVGRPQNMAFFDHDTLKIAAIPNQIKDNVISDSTTYSSFKINSLVNNAGNGSGSNNPDSLANYAGNDYLRKTQLTDSLNARNYTTAAALNQYLKITDTTGKWKYASWVPTWNDVSNKPTFSIVAASGDYNDLINKPAGAPTTKYDWVDVKDFGAIPNNPSIDNSVAITNAVDSAFARGIRRVVVSPKDTFYIKNAIKIRHSNIQFENNGVIIGMNAVTPNIYSTAHSMLLVSPKVRWHGSATNRLENVSVIGGVWDQRQVTPATAAEYIDSSTNWRDAADDWAGGHTIEFDDITNGVISGTTVLGSINGTYGVANPYNVQITNNTVRGFRNVLVTDTRMVNGNVINISALDPAITNGGKDSIWLGGTTVSGNDIDGLQQDTTYPVYLVSNTVPMGMANIGINVATEPFSYPRAYLTGVNIVDNKIRHAVWGINVEGQFANGSKSGSRISGNYIEECYIGLGSITNTWNLNNAKSFTITDNVIKNTLKKAIQSYGSNAIITGNLIEELGLAKKSDSVKLKSIFPYGAKMATGIEVFPFNMSATDSMVGGNIVVSGNVLKNTLTGDTATYFPIGVQGINLYAKGKQVAKNITIANNILNVIGNPQDGGASDYPNGITVAGKVDGLKIVNSTLEGFPGTGITFFPSEGGTVDDAAKNVLIDGVTFRNNQSMKQFSGGTEILVRSGVKNLSLVNSTFDQTGGKTLGSIVGMGGNWLNGGVPFNFNNFRASNNTYKGFTNGVEVYDFGNSTMDSAYINDPLYYSNRSSIPANATTKYIAGTIIRTSTPNANYLGWQVRTTGIGSAAVWDTIRISGGGGGGGGSGTVTSVGGTGTVSGITLSGTVTSSGNLTLGGSISGLTTSNLSGSAGITNAQLANSSITIAGSSTALGGSISRDAITGVSTNGLIKRTGANTYSVATAGTDYLTGNQTTTLSGDISGSGTTAITTTIGAGKVTNAMLAGSIANNKLSNYTISGIGLGSDLNNLSLGSGLQFNSGSTYNGSTARTLSPTFGTTSGTVMEGNWRPDLSTYVTKSELTDSLGIADTIWTRGALHSEFNPNNGRQTLFADSASYSKDGILLAEDYSDFKSKVSSVKMNGTEYFPDAGHQINLGNISGGGNPLWTDLGSGNINYAAGNVGINKTTPSYPLDVNGVIKSGGYKMGSDMILKAVSGGQSTISSWWGLQLRGNATGSVDDNSSNVGSAGQFSVVVPNGNAGATAFGVVGASSQTGHLQTWMNSNLDTLAYVNNIGSAKFKSLRIDSLKTTKTAPATVGTTKMVVTDTTGKLSFADIPSGGGGGTFSGSIATGQVAFGTASNTLGGDDGLYWDNTNKRLSLGSGASPTSKFNLTTSDSTQGFYFDGGGTANTRIGTIKTNNGAGGIIFTTYGVGAATYSLADYTGGRWGQVLTNGGGLSLRIVGNVGGSSVRSGVDINMDANASGNFRSTLGLQNQESAPYIKAFKSDTTEVFSLNYNGGASFASAVTTPTPIQSDSSTTVATTAFVKQVAKSNPIKINAPTANYTLVLDDAGKLITQNSSSATTITVPTNASVAFPIGTQVTISQENTGQVTISGASGVTVNSADSKNKTRVRYSTVTLIKKATDTWLLAGDID